MMDNFFIFFKIKYVKRIVVKIFLILFFSFLGFSQRNRISEKRNFVPYRGMRIATEQTEFIIKRIYAKKIYNEENSLMEITVRFSMPVDPRTVNLETVLLNEEKCGSNVFFNFGRKGESVRITIVNENIDVYSLKFLKIESYKGDQLKETEFENIQNGTEINRE